MSYASDRRIIDIDAHVMEPRGWLRSFAAAGAIDSIPELDELDAAFGQLLDDADLRFAARHADSDVMAATEIALMTMPNKGWMSLGGWDTDERSRALDLLGFELQVVFPTGSFNQVMRTPAEYQLEAARAMNRGLSAFCEDPRLRAVHYVPFTFGAEAASAMVADAVSSKVGGLLVDSIPGSNARSFTHPHFDPVWASIEAADLPVFLHVGADQGHRPVRRSFFDNGRHMPHLRSDAPGDALSFMAIGHPGELFLAAMVFDGVLERFPRLRIGVTELGATWLPSFLHFIDTGFRSFKGTQDFSHLTTRPSDYLRRQVVVSPFAGEDVGWIIEQAGSDMVAFSSDYPHHEGTDDPIRRFEASMTSLASAERDAFYFGNGERLLGAAAP